MTPEQTELAKQLVAQPDWRWIPGMLVVTSIGSHRLESPTVETDAWGYLLDGDDYSFDLRDVLPDLSDRATACMVLAMALEAGWDTNGNGPVSLTRQVGRISMTTVPLNDIGQTAAWAWLQSKS